jgi:hypothetical protein
MRAWTFVLCLGVLAAATPAPGGAQEPPVIPVGLDAYRQWEKWPVLRIGQQTFMRSTYDRRGGNESADASHFLYQREGDRNVTLDLEGPGVLNFVRYNHWHGSPWHYLVDSADFALRETSTADPDHPREGATFIPADLFPEPLAWTWATTRGADLIGVPIPFTRSFRMEYERTHYGTGYYIFSRYVPGARLSRPLRAWDGRTPPAADVTALVARAGTDLVPWPESAEGRRIGLRERHGAAVLRPGEAAVLSLLDEAPATIRALELSAPRDRAIALGKARLRITWDDRAAPSVDAPVALFYGAGTLYNRDSREYLVKAFPVSVRFDVARVYLACCLPMPFFKSARIELIAPDGPALTDVHWSVRYAPLRKPPEQVGYFHATYRDHPRPGQGRDLILLDTRETEGGGDWTGHLIGTSFIFSHSGNLGTLEGDPRFFFDDSRTPQVHGTGTEEWGGGGDYWGGQNMTLPFFGHPAGARSPQAAKSDEDKIESAYRFLLADMMPFGRNARIGLEHGGTNESTEHYETVAYWYGAPGATLVPTDELRVGDAASEAAHGYSSPQASAPVEVTSRYELGVDHLNGVEIYPEETDRGRTTTGTSEFTLSIDPRNVGVLLRRKLDYSYPNQRAEVSIADASDGERAAPARWRPAGIWYLAGSNTCVFSNPKEETGAAQHIVQTSNRRFRDDDFLLPLSLTRGRKAIRVRVRFTPVARPLYPGYRVPPLAWSELRYTAFSYRYPATMR